ncbi:MAG: glycosyltransferase family 9 protein [Bacteroidales bacterium]|nr:glycosyltransferase family 9 protein [Bacteroidales bacterium]
MQKIILSRTDSIGDVILTLPMAGVLKEMLPGCRIIFLGRDYTRDIISLSVHVDEFISWDDISKIENNAQPEFIKKTEADTIIHVFPKKEIAAIAKKAGIKNRIGTSGRLYHYFTCNKRVNFSRKRSELHEAQLNLKLLRPLGWRKNLNLSELESYYGLTKKPALVKEFSSLIDPSRVNLILHPKSRGSAREWGLDNFRQLIEILDQTKYKIFVTGTEEEGKEFRKHISFNSNCLDVSGRMSLKQLVAFIDQADGLIAASTGPLHIAAALEKVAIGIYPPIKPMHPGRWAPVGPKATFLVLDKDCSDCRKEGSCHCMAVIKPQKVQQILEDHFGK